MLPRHTTLYPYLTFTVLLASHDGCQNRDTTVYKRQMNRLQPPTSAYNHQCLWRNAKGQRILRDILKVVIMHQSLYVITVMMLHLSLYIKAVVILCCKSCDNAPNVYIGTIVILHWSRYHITTAILLLFIITTRCHNNVCRSWKLECCRKACAMYFEPMLMGCSDSCRS